MTSDARVETPFKGRLFKVQMLSWKTPNGREIRREVVRHPGAVLIIPVRAPAASGARVVMIRNWRMAVGKRLWEFPAGKLEDGEEPIKAAARELEEETGFRAGVLRKLGEFYTSPGFTDELMRVFLAEDLSPCGQRLEEDEDIEVRTVALDDVLAMIRRGEIRDGKTIAGVLMWREGAGELST